MLYIDNIPLVEYNNIIQVEYVVINMLKHGILGLLNYGDMTGYEIMKVFRDSLSFFWTANTSQIYRELNTLKKRRICDRHCCETNRKARQKSVFHNRKRTGRAETLAERVRLRKQE